MNHGIEFEKDHSVITFREGAWLKPYIELIQLMILRKIFISYVLIVHMVRPWKMLENIEILD